MQAYRTGKMAKLKHSRFWYSHSI